MCFRKFPLTCVSFSSPLKGSPNGTAGHSDLNPDGAVVVNPIPDVPKYKK